MKPAEGWPPERRRRSRRAWVGAMSIPLRGGVDGWVIPAVPGSLYCVLLALYGQITRARKRVSRRTQNPFRLVEGVMREDEGAGAGLAGKPAGLGAGQMPLIGLRL